MQVKPIPDFDLQVVIVAGPEEPKRAILGLAMAASAAGCGRRVLLYFVMNGARFLLSENCGKSFVSGFPTVAEMVGVVHEDGGAILYCPNCLQGECDSSLRPKMTEEAVCQLAKPGGISSIGMQLGIIPVVVF